jgi:MFS family permease
VKPIRYLKNRIRGWLPKESKVPVVPAKTDSRINKRPLTTKQMGKVKSATRDLLPSAILVAVFSLFFMTRVNADFNLPLASQVTWLITGLMFGSIISASLAKRDLNRLARDKEIRSFTMVVAVLFVVGFVFIFSGILVVVLFTGLPGWIQGGFLSSFFAGGSISTVVRYVLFLRWEKKNKMRILQNRSRFFVVPQSDTNNTADTQRSV